MKARARRVEHSISACYIFFVDPPSAPNAPKALVAAGRSSSAVSAPSYGATEIAQLPHVDERLARPGVWEDVRDGVVHELTPADEKHGNAHHHVSLVIGTVVRDEYAASTDRLTRTGVRTDFAPDVAIFPREKTEDGHSKMAEVAFEIADSQSRNDARWKAEKLIERGCRRVFLLDVDKSVLCEYDRATDDWRELAADALIEDRTFTVPIWASNLLDKIMNDALILNALRAKNSAVLTEILLDEARRGEAFGVLTQARRALYRVLKKRFNVTEDPRIEACTDVSALEHWLDQAIAAPQLEHVFLVSPPTKE